MNRQTKDLKELTTFADLQAGELAAEQWAAMDRLTHQFAMLVDEAMRDPETADKMDAVAGLGREFLSLAADILSGNSNKARRFTDAEIRKLLLLGVDPERLEGESEAKQKGLYVKAGDLASYFKALVNAPPEPAPEPKPQWFIKPLIEG